ncbi:chemotaxis response regulator containing a CheY-like receiver domain and a methylesterase domain [Synechococcus sp. PCC 7502]|uniref:chemotaxis-specific protein-glutamate methyltransferase CheB n=1 Tax=Synechococcus sp. PCC 7502 TaxID=1173263 RepID=UPI00029FE655|nr:chemotaxis-specific protein-glutamate methyltransferase CheB [Synechococcus sp. PCC 7502]AFY74178.1 chemotaxis response regulator containing a CheY-like receiver domain and a methylesterase domain [Synechococcus sp. PCC 7502]
MIPVNVLLVEDSPIALEILQRILSTSPDIQVVGVAHNGKQALDLIPTVKPDVICVDMFMERMDGLELIRQVMAKFPCPILVVSNAVQSSDTDNIFRLLQAGAVDVFPKPATGLPSDYEKVKAALINKIKVLSGVRVFTRPLKDLEPPKPAIASVIQSQIQSPLPVIPLVDPIAALKSQFKVLAIGASTGGPSAFEKILYRFPANFPMPIICAQHISEGFLAGLVTWLDTNCALKVKIAQVGELPQPGIIYFAPETHHLELDNKGKFIYAVSSQTRAYRPSITMLFQSIARFYGKTCMAALLTGMGNDGAEGLKTIFDHGGLTIAQDESSSVIFGMPKEAIALGAARYILPLQDIAPFLITQAVSSRSN